VLTGHDAQRPGLAAVAHFEFSKCSGRSGVNFFMKRRAAPQSHGSKPMLGVVFYLSVVGVDIKKLNVSGKT